MNTMDDLMQAIDTYGSDQTFTPYAKCTRDDPANCAKCDRPLAGDNNVGICFMCQRIAAWSLGSTITLPKGHTVGMGKLRKPTPAKIVRIEKREDNSTFYCAQMEDGRYTYI